MLNNLAASLTPQSSLHPFYTNNKLPSLPLQLLTCLSIHVTFHFLLLFSAVFSPDPGSPLKDACGFLAACCYYFFFPLPIPQLAHGALFEVALRLFKHLGQHQRPHITRGQSSTESRCSSSIISPPLLFYRGSCFTAALLKERNSEAAGGDGGGGDTFSPCVCVHHVSWPLLAFMFCLAESPAPAVSVSSLKNRCPSEGGDALSSASISAGLCSHLADTSSSADTFTPAWVQLADRQLSVRIKQSRTHTVV